MNILEKNKNLFGKKIIVKCDNKRTFVGEWAEWWSEEDNSYLADDGLAVCESIMLTTSDNVAYEILITEIKDIQRA